MAMSEREKTEMSDKEILALALANGFQLKQQPDGSMSLHPYVWKFAHALIEAALSTRKPYGYGIVDKGGKKQASILLSEMGAKNYVETYKLHCPEKEFRAVPLFYEDQS
jgi:hypothetical protein